MRGPPCSLREDKKRVVAATALAALLVAGTAAYLARGLIRERWCLFLLSRGTDDSSWPLVVELYDRRCLEVTRYLLEWYRLHPIAWREGTIGMQSDTPGWSARIHTVVALGSQTVPYLTERLRDGTDSSEALFLLHVLGHLGSEASVAAPTIVDYARLHLVRAGSSAGESLYFQEAFIALSKLGERGVSSMQALARLGLKLDAERQDIALAYEVCLGLCKFETPSVLPLLKDLLELEARLPIEHELSLALVLKLGQLGPAAQEAVPVLERAFGLSALKLPAAAALAAVVPGHVTALEHLREQLADPRSEHWPDAADMVRRVAPRAPQLVPLLARGFEVEARIELDVLFWSMTQLDPDAATGFLLTRLEATDTEKRRGALEILLRLHMRELRPDVLRKLEHLAADDDEGVAWAAAEALAKAREVSPLALDIYRRRFRDGDPELAGSFGEDFGYLTLRDAGARDVLRRALTAGNRSAEVALQAVAVQSDDTEFLPLIRKLSAAWDKRLADLATKMLENLQKPPPPTPAYPAP